MATPRRTPRSPCSAASPSAHTPGAEESRPCTSCRPRNPGTCAVWARPALRRGRSAATRRPAPAARHPTTCALRSCFFRTQFARLTASPEDAAEKRIDLPLCDVEDCAGRTGVGDVRRVFQQRPAGCALQTGVAILNPRPETGEPETVCLRVRRRRSPGGHAASTRPFPSARPAVSSGGRADVEWRPLSRSKLWACG